MTGHPRRIVRNGNGRFVVQTGRLVGDEWEWNSSWWIGYRWLWSARWRMKRAEADQRRARRSIEVVEVVEVAQ